MAAYNKRLESVTRHIYELDSPAHASEISKAITAAYSEQEDLRLSSDVFVESWDDKVLVVWEERKSGA